MNFKLIQWNIFIISAAVTITGVIISSAGHAKGFNLSKLRSALTLDAFPKADNGKAVGMKVTLTRETLIYKSVNGTFQLEAPSLFDLTKMAVSYQAAYKNADGAFVYPVSNWKEIEALNHSNVHFSGDQAPKFIYLYRANYILTGQPGVFVCTIVNPDLAAFYATAAGHGRCDVFKDK